MIIITGGAGFIGSALVAGLNESGNDDLMIVDRFGSGVKWKNLAKRSFARLLHKDELLDWLKTASNQVKIDAIVHLGASSSTTVVDTDYLVANNINYSLALWKFCTEQRVPFIYASSASTYGDGSLGFADSGSNVVAATPLNPYGFSKVKFDAMALGSKATPPFWAGLRFFNVYGPQEYHKGGQASCVWQFFPQIKKREEVNLFKSYRADVAHGEQQRDFVYVKDCVKVILHFLKEHAQAESGIYNVGSGQARSFRDLASGVFKCIGKKTQIEWIEMPVGLRDHYQYFTEAKLDRLRRCGGYNEPMTSLEDGIGDYVKNYLERADLYL